jgi:hypothetical protein
LIRPLCASKASTLKKRWQFHGKAEVRSQESEARRKEKQNNSGLPLIVLNSEFWIPAMVIVPFVDFALQYVAFLARAAAALSAS